MTMVLTSKGFGPRDVQLRLDRLNLIVGPVHTGKSTILNMMRYAVLGYVPGIGKLDAITARHMAGDEMSVTVELPDRRTFTREHKRDGDGFTKRLSASWAEGKIKVVHPQVLERFGRHVEQIEQHLDQTQFLRLSPDMRARTIDGMLAEGSTPAVLGQQCAKHIVLKLIGISEDAAPEKWRELIPRLSKEDRALLSEYQPTLKAVLNDKGIGGAIAEFSRLLSEEDKEQKKRRAAADELSEDAAGLDVVQQDEIDQLEQVVQDFDQKIGAWNAKRPDLDEFDRSMGRLTRELDSLLNESDEGATEEQKNRLTTARTQLANAEKALDATDEPPAADTTEHTQRIDQLAREVEKIEEERDPNAPTDEEIKEATTAHTSAETKIQTLERSPWGEVATAQEIVTEVNEALKGKKGITELRKKLTEATTTLAKHCSEEGKKLEVARAELETAAAKLDELTPPWRAERDRRAREQEAKDALNKARTDKTNAEQASAAERETYTNAEQAVADARNAVRTIETEIAQADERAAGLSGRIQAKREEIEKLKAPEDPGEPTELEQARDEANTRLTAMRSAKAKLDQLKAKTAEIEKAQARRTVLMAFREAAKRVGADEATKKRAPLVGIMREFFEACDLDGEPYFELGGDNPRIGVQRLTPIPDADPGLKVRTIDVSVLSGNEWGIFTAGLNIAMQQLREVPVKVIPIEGGEIEGLGPDIVPLMKGLREKQDLFDCVLLTCHGIPADVEGWNVIDVTTL